MRRGAMYPTHADDPWPRALRVERLRRGLTQAEFAVLIGYAPYANVVSRIETGARILGPRTRARIEACLGTRLIGEELDT